MTSGPFVNMTVNLGPDGLVLPGNVTDDSMFPYEYNPRCLKRSLTDYALTRYANETSIQTLLSQSQDIWEFEVVLQGPLGEPRRRDPYTRLPPLSTLKIPKTNSREERRKKKTKRKQF